MLFEAFVFQKAQVWGEITISSNAELTASLFPIQIIKLNLATIKIYNTGGQCFVIQIQKKWDSFEVETIAVDFNFIEKNHNFPDGKAYRKYRKNSAEESIFHKRCEVHVYWMCAQWSISGELYRRVHSNVSNRSLGVSNKLLDQQQLNDLVQLVEAKRLTRLVNFKKFPHSDNYNAFTKTMLDNSFSSNFYMSAAFQVLASRLRDSNGVLTKKLAFITIQVADDLCLSLNCTKEPTQLFKDKLKSTGLLRESVCNGLLFTIERSGKRSGVERAVKLKNHNCMGLNIHIIASVDKQEFERLEIRRNLAKLSTGYTNSVSIKFKRNVKDIESDSTTGEQRVVSYDTGITLGVVDYLTKEIDQPICVGKSNWATVKISTDVAALKKKKYKQQVKLNRQSLTITTSENYFEVEKVAEQILKVLEV